MPGVRLALTTYRSSGGRSNYLSYPGIIYLLKLLITSFAPPYMPISWSIYG